MIYGATKAFISQFATSLSAEVLCIVPYILDDIYDICNKECDFLNRYQVNGDGLDVLLVHPSPILTSSSYNNNNDKHNTSHSPISTLSSEYIIIYSVIVSS